MISKIIITFIDETCHLDEPSTNEEPDSSSKSSGAKVVNIVIRRQHQELQDRFFNSTDSKPMNYDWSCWMELPFSSGFWSRFTIKTICLSFVKFKWQNLSQWSPRMRMQSISCWVRNLSARSEKSTLSMDWFRIVPMRLSIVVHGQTKSASDPQRSSCGIKCQGFRSIVQLFYF